MLISKVEVAQRLLKGESAFTICMDRFVGRHSPGDGSSEDVKRYYDGADRHTIVWSAASCAPESKIARTGMSIPSSTRVGS